jgi:cytoskeletal protein RodZ
LAGEDMKKKKWTKRLVWVGSSAAMLLVIGYFGMNVAMSYFLNSMIPTIPLEISQGVDEEDRLIVSDVSDVNSKTNTTTVTKESTNPNVQKLDEATATLKPQGTTIPIDKPTEKPGTGSSTQKTNESKSVDQISTPSPTATKNGTGYEAQITTEKAKEVQDEITLKEKASVTSVLLKKLSASDLQLFAKMAGNGLSVDEKKKAKDIILQKLSEDEYNQLIGIAAKYGLSQGKKFADTQPKSTK